MKYDNIIIHSPFFSDSTKMNKKGERTLQKMYVCDLPNKAQLLKLSYVIGNKRNSRIELE